MEIFNSKHNGASALGHRFEIIKSLGRRGAPRARGVGPLPLCEGADPCQPARLRDGALSPDAAGQGAGAEGPGGGSQEEQDSRHRRR